MSTQQKQATAIHEKVALLIEESVELHTLPVVAVEADRIMRDSDSSAQDIANLIAKDPALAERVLRLSNSSFYGFQRRIGNLTQAIVILGFQAVRNLLLTVGVIDCFKSNTGDDTDYPAFWAHSVATAIAAHQIAGLCNSKEQDEAYIAGLLHDAGKLIIVQHLPELQNQIQELVRQSTPQIEAEAIILGRTHAEIGARIAHSWGLPENINEAIKHHHCCTEEIQEASSLASILQLADSIVHGLGIGNRLSSLPELSPHLSARLGYDSAKLETWLGNIVESIECAGDFFEYIGAGPIQLTTGSPENPQ